MESIATQSIQTVEFPCEEWFVTRTPQGELVSIRPVPGTWTLLSFEDQKHFAEHGQDVKAMFACPNCKQTGFISSQFNPPKEMGDTKPLPELHCRKCNFGCRIILKNWDKRRMYCACYETLDANQNVLTHKHYLHAEDEIEARKFFWAQQAPLAVIHLVGIAPVIGFFTAKANSDKILLV
jgi:hypothetical protein